MLAFIYAAVSYFSWGLGDVFGTIASRKIGAIPTAFWAAFFGWLLFAFYAPFALPELSGYTWPLLGLNLVLGFLFLSGNLAFNEAVRVSTAPVVGSVAASFTAVTVILSILFLDVSATIEQLLVIALIFVGVIICTIDWSHVKKGTKWIDQGVLFAIYAMLAWGIGFAFVRILIDKVGWYWPFFIAMSLFPLFILYAKYREVKITIPNWKDIKTVASSGALLRIGDFSFNAAIGAGFVAIVAPIGGAYPTLYVAMTAWLFKEPLTWQQQIGIGVTLIGIIGLGFLGAH